MALWGTMGYHHGNTVGPTGREFPSTLPAAFRVRAAPAFRTLRGSADCRDPGDAAMEIMILDDRSTES
jgi:hypothetical protein